MKRKNPVFVALAVAAVFLLMPSASFAACASTSGGPTPTVGLITLQPGNGASNGLIDGAIDKWKPHTGGGCSNIGSGFPDLQRGTSGGRVLTVNMGGINAGGAGHCGSFSGTTITVYSFTTVGSQQVSCGDPATVLAHEIGHAMGLNDSSCSGYIMETNYNSSNPRDVKSAECQKVDERNVIPGEWGFPSPPGGPGQPGCRWTIIDDGAELTQLAIAGPQPPRGAGGPSLFDRSETAEGFRYLLENWAVVTYRTDRSGRVAQIAVANTSSGPYGATQAERLGAERLTGAGAVLIVDEPPHPFNERHIPLPEVGFRPQAVPYLGPPLSVVVRLDFAENRDLRDSQILYATGALPDAFDLLGTVEGGLTLRFASEQQHRVIVFLVLDIADGRLVLRESWVVRPMCCCTPLCY